MDVETLLVVAQHCVRRTELYHRKILFFLEIVDILEDHANANYKLDIPKDSEEITAKLQQLRNVKAAEEKKIDELVLQSIRGTSSDSSESTVSD